MSTSAKLTLFAGARREHSIVSPLFNKHFIRSTEFDENLSQKLHQKKIWTHSEKLDRLRKITILRPNFRNKLFLKLD